MFLWKSLIFLWHSTQGLILRMPEMSFTSYTVAISSFGRALTTNNFQVVSSSIIKVTGRPRLSHHHRPYEMKWNETRWMRWECRNGGIKFVVEQNGRNPDKNLPRPLFVHHGRLARWRKWKSFDVWEAKEGLVNELWRSWSNGRVGEWAVTWVKREKGWRMSWDVG